MKKTRLFVRSREALLAAAYRGVKERVKINMQNTEKFEDALLTIIEELFPTSDMDVLIKYGVAKKDMCIRIHLNYDVSTTIGDNYSRSGTYHVYRFSENRAPVLPECKTIQLDKLTTDLFAAASVDHRIAKDERERRCEAYRTLIYTANTFEDVLSVWPEAEALRSEIFGSENAVAVTVTEDVVAAIRADVSDA